MTVTHAPTRPVSTLPVRLAAGVAGGLVGGVAFGALMQSWGMIPMVAMLAGSESPAVGWAVHLFNSALFGLVFALVTGRWATSPARSVVLGVAYGAAWWVLGALVIMPAWLGMNEMIFQVNDGATRSLWGHLLFGLLLGAVSALVPRLATRGSRTGVA